jgi:hypothetical protein
MADGYKLATVIGIQALHLFRSGYRRNAFVEGEGRGYVG